MVGTRKTELFKTCDPLPHKLEPSLPLVVRKHFPLLSCLSQRKITLMFWILYLVRHDCKAFMNLLVPKFYDSEKFSKVKV